MNSSSDEESREELLERIKLLEEELKALRSSSPSFQTKLYSVLQNLEREELSEDTKLKLEQAVELILKYAKLRGF